MIILNELGESWIFVLWVKNTELSKCKETAIKVCENKVERSSHICLVGTWLDEQLSMKHQITLK